jgi:tetratricopeptide (TPR) repeat protein
MPTFASLQIPPPANWQDFETLCCDLWRLIWNDPNTQKNGRSGQPQHGVDVWGRPNQGDEWAGVQCREKDFHGGKSLSVKEVSAEVKKAKSFLPKLSQFTIATTGKKDVKIEEFARKITEQHLKKNLFSVHVLGWEDIKERVAGFSDLMENYYPRFSPSTKALKDEIDKIKETGQAILQNGAETKALVSSLPQQIQHSNKLDYREIAEVILIPEYQAQLDHSRDLLNSNRPKEALQFLEDLKGRIWSSAPSMVKYRITTNIAVAKLAMNQEQQAAKLFLEAQQYNPDDENALYNAGLGYVLLGQLDDSIKSANKVLEKNPGSTKAYSIIVQASSKDETLDEIISRVPEAHRNSRECAFAIADQARKRGKPEEAKKWLETAIENDSDDLPELKAALGEILLSLMLQDSRVANAHLINDSEREIVQKIVQLLTQAWERISKTDLKDFRLGWVVNRGIAKGLLNDYAGAVNDIETALDVEPSNPLFIKYRAMLAREGKDNKKAEVFLKDIINAPETPEASLLLAEVLLEEKRPNEAIAILEESLQRSVSILFRLEANRLLIQAHIDSGNFEEARRISDFCRASDPVNILNLVDAARISRADAKSQEAIDLLREAMRYVNESSTFGELYGLANTLYSLEQFEDAASIYERIADKSTDSPLTRRLLNSYYRSGERGKALHICQNLRKKHGPLKYVSEIESAIYEEIGDLAKAEEVCKEYLRLFPDDFEMKLRLAVVNFRANDFEELDNFLKSPIDLDALSLEAGLQIAYLYEARGLSQKSLEIMYEIRRKFFSRAEAHLKYIGFIFQRREDVDQLLNIDKISVNSAVCVEDGTHRKDWYIIEDRQDADMSRREINLKHPLAKKLLSKLIGEEVILRETQFGKESGKIVATKSKYVHAFHESLSLFSKLFPSHTGIVGVKIGAPRKRGEPPSGFEPVLEQVNKQQEFGLKVEQFYKQGVLTIGAFANLVGRNVLEVWGGLMSNPDLGLRCCLGNSSERNHAASLLVNKPKLAVDIISLMTLHGIDGGDAIVRAFGKLGIAQSTVDFLQETIDERKGIWSKGFMTIGKEGDQFVRQEISSEDVERNVEYLKGILEWVRNNCEVIPCRAALNMKKDQKQQLDELIGSMFVDTVLVASEPGNLLYSDDERLRLLAKMEFGVEGVWTQVVLMHCLDLGNPERSKYNQMVVKLAYSNYYHTSVDAHVLIEAAAQSHWSPTPPYTKVVNVLGGKHSEENSALTVGTNFLYELWKQPILSHQRDYLVLSLLNAITTERKPGAILDKLILHVKKRFLLIPLAEGQIIGLVRVWRQTHIT